MSKGAIGGKSVRRHYGLIIFSLDSRGSGTPGAAMMDTSGNNIHLNKHNFTVDGDTVGPQEAAIFLNALEDL